MRLLIGLHVCGNEYGVDQTFCIVRLRTMYEA